MSSDNLVEPIKQRMKPWLNETSSLQIKPICIAETMSSDIKPQGFNVIPYEDPRDSKPSQENGNSSLVSDVIVDIPETKSEASKQVFHQR